MSENVGNEVLKPGENSNTGLQKGIDPAGRYPDSLNRRISWSPAALKGLNSTISGIKHHIEPLVNNSARYSLLYWSMTRRIMPWGGWNPVTMEKPDADGENTAAEDAVKASTGVSVMRPENPVKMAILQREPEKPVEQSTIQKSIGAYGSNGNDKPGVKKYTAEAGLNAQGYNFLPRPARISEAWPRLPGTEYKQLDFQIYRSMSIVPRREISNGIAGEKPVLHPVKDAGLHESGSLSVKSHIPGHTAGEQSHGAVNYGQSNHYDSPLDTPLFNRYKQKEQRNAERPGYGAPVTGSNNSEEYGSSFDEKTEDNAAFDKLFEKLLMKDREMEISFGNSQTAHEREEKDDKNDSTPVEPQTIIQQVSTAPEIDINSISEAVYENILRRQIIERERRGY